MPNLSVDYLQNTAGSITIPVHELKTRVVQYYQGVYENGEWNPTTTFNWVPGAYLDFTPKRADTRIKFSMRLPMGWYSATHSIGHWQFWAANLVYWYWSESGTHIENGKNFEFEVPSWGTSTARIGLKHRSYSEDSNENRPYSTNFWDGGGSRQNCKGQLIIQEILH